MDIDGSIIIGDLSNRIRRIDINNNLVTSISFPEIKENIYSLSGSLKRTLYIGTNYAIYKLEENVWKYERYLWIGYLKEKSSYCYLSSLPKEIIKEIASHLWNYNTNMISYSLFERQPRKKESLEQDRREDVEIT